MAKTPKKEKRIFLRGKIYRIVARLQPLLAPNDDHDQCLTADEVAKHLIAERFWVYRRTQRNEIPFKKEGKYLRFKKTAIDSWLDHNLNGPLGRR